MLSTQPRHRPWGQMASRFSAQHRQLEMGTHLSLQE